MFSDWCQLPCVWHLLQFRKLVRTIQNIALTLNRHYPRACTASSSSMRPPSCTCLCGCVHVLHAAICAASFAANVPNNPSQRCQVEADALVSSMQLVCKKTCKGVKVLQKMR